MFLPLPGRGGKDTTATQPHPRIYQLSDKLLELVSLKTVYNTDPVLLPAEQIQDFAYATVHKEMHCWAQ